MSAWPILAHFLAHFYAFSSKLPEIAKFFLNIMIFVIFNTFLYLFGANSRSIKGGGGNFQFSANFARFSLVQLKYDVISRD